MGTCHKLGRPKLFKWVAHIVTEKAGGEWFANCTVLIFCRLWWRMHKSKIDSMSKWQICSHSLNTHCRRLFCWSLLTCTFYFENVSSKWTYLPCLNWAVMVYKYIVLFFTPPCSAELPAFSNTLSNFGDLKTLSFVVHFLSSAPTQINVFF